MLGHSTALAKFERSILSHRERNFRETTPSAPASYLWGAHCLRVGIVQLVQSNAEILLKHWEASSAKIPLYFLTQSTREAGKEREGKGSGTALLPARPGSLHPHPPRLLPNCPGYLKAWMRVQAARLLWDSKAQKSPSTKPCERGNKEHQFSPARPQKVYGKGSLRSCTLSFCALVEGSDLSFVFFSFPFFKLTSSRAEHQPSARSTDSSATRNLLLRLMSEDWG